MRVIHEVGKYISIEQDGVERLRYHYSLPDDPRPVAPKPFFHPIRTPDGLEMTARSPIDHLWQRGLWFTFRYLNGVNYWEENQQIVGRQYQQPGSGVRLDTDAARNRVRWVQRFVWSDTQAGEVTERLHEIRTLVCELQAEGIIRSILTSRITPREDLVLDRTPFTTWGGYGGLYIRMTQALQKQRLVLAGETPEDEPTVGPAAIGSPHRWGGIEGQLDTRYDQGERWGAFVFFPSPHNTRFPEPFYGDARPFYNFFGAAPLFHEPIVLKSDETFTYRIATLILPHRIETTWIERQYAIWHEKERKRAMPSIGEELEFDE